MNEPTAPKTSVRWWRHCALLALSLLYTAFVIQWSLREGRLAQSITFDDSAYFIDAYQRLESLYSGGVQALLAGLWEHPPHSPYSTLLAFTAFLLFGPVNWAPYAANFIQFAGLLALVLHACRQLGVKMQAAFAVGLLSVPLSITSVHEFRPDFAVGLLTAAGVYFASIWAGEACRPNAVPSADILRAGACFGGALVVKPPFFPHTLVMLGLCGLLIALAARCSARSLGWVVRSWILLSLPAALIAAPLYLRNARTIWNYFAVNTSGAEAPLWRIAGGWKQSLVEFTVAGAPASMLGNYFWVAILVLVAGLVWHGKAGRTSSVIFIVGVLVCVVASVAILAYGRYANAFFGLPYQILLVISMVHVLAQFLSASRSTRLTVAWGLALLFALNLFGLGKNQLLASTVPRPKTEEARISRELLSCIERDVPRPFAQPLKRATVLVTFAGEVNAGILEWITIQTGSPRLDFVDRHRLGSVPEMLAEAQRADFTIVFEPGTPGPYFGLPSFGIQGALGEALRASDSHSLVGRANAVVGGYLVFANRARLAIDLPRNRLQWPGRTEGFLGLEGPYKELQLGFVRWGISPASQLFFDRAEAGEVELILEARAAPGLLLTVRVNADVVNTHRFSGPDFQAVRSRFPARAGLNKISIEYGDSKGPEQGTNERAVLYRAMELTAESSSRGRD